MTRQDPTTLSGYVDSRPAREHLVSLLARGATMRSVAEAASCSSHVLRRLLAGQPAMQARTARRVLAVTVERVMARDREHGLVPAVGSRRRIQALMVMGWRHQDITARMRAAGVDTHSALILSQEADRVEARTAAAVRAAYDALWSRPGPCAATRTRATRAGWAPPLAWDDDTIDDPTARPLGMEGSLRRHRAQLLEDVTDLVADGATVESACARLGVQRRNLERSLQRAGRHDLWRRLTGASPLARQEAS